MQLATITLTHAQVLAFRLQMRDVNSPKALISVRLHKIRKALEVEAEPIAKAFEEIDRRHALVEDGHPKVKSDKGASQFWAATGTPAYVVDPAKEKERLNELATLEEASTEISVPQLTEADLADILGSEHAGPALEAFLAST